MTYNMIFSAGVVIFVCIIGVILSVLTKKLTSFTPPLSLTIIAAIIGIVGMVLTWHATDLLQQSFDRKHWPTSQAQVLSSEVVGEKRAFRPQIIYQFFVDSIAYQNQTDLNISGFGNKRARRDNAKRIAGEYTGIKALTVYYNPADPNESYVRTGPFWSDYMKLMLGVIIIIASINVLLLSVVHRRTNSNTHT